MIEDNDEQTQHDDNELKVGIETVLTIPKLDLKGWFDK
jgi:hypothetical protein